MADTTVVTIVSLLIDQRVTGGASLRTSMNDGSSHSCCFANVTTLLTAGYTRAAAEGKGWPAWDFNWRPGSPGDECFVVGRLAGWEPLAMNNSNSNSREPTVMENNKGIYQLLLVGWLAGWLVHWLLDWLISHTLYTMKRAEPAASKHQDTAGKIGGVTTSDFAYGDYSFLKGHLSVVVFFLELFKQSPTTKALVLTDNCLVTLPKKFLWKQICQVTCKQIGLDPSTGKRKHFHAENSVRYFFHCQGQSGNGRISWRTSLHNEKQVEPVIPMAFPVACRQ